MGKVKAIKVLINKKIYGVRYYAGQVVSNPLPGLVAYAKGKVKISGYLVCEFVKDEPEDAKEEPKEIKLTKNALGKMNKIKLIELIDDRGIAYSNETKKELIAMILGE